MNGGVIDVTVKIIFGGRVACLLETVSAELALAVVVTGNVRVGGRRWDGGVTV